MLVCSHSLVYLIRASTLLFSLCHINRSWSCRSSENSFLGCVVNHAALVIMLVYYRGRLIVHRSSSASASANAHRTTGPPCRSQGLDEWTGFFYLVLALQARSLAVLKSRYKTESPLMTFPFIPFQQLHASLPNLFREIFRYPIVYSSL